MPDVLFAAAAAIVIPLLACKLIMNRVEPLELVYIDPFCFKDFRHSITPAQDGRESSLLGAIPPFLLLMWSSRVSGH